MPWAAWARRKLFGVRPRDVSFAALGARIDPPQQTGLQAIVDSARTGFNVTLEDDRLEDLTDRVTRAVDPAMVGFAHEGAAMCLTLLDAVRDRGRVPRLLERCEGTYDFFVPLGVGFALARIPWRRAAVERHAARLPPVYDGLVLNGLGFHQGCFRSGGALERTPRPRRLSPAAARCFDHGLGRALWFMCGGSPERIGGTLARIEADRHGDLWAGVGTACAFAGRAYADEAGYRAALAGLEARLGPHRGMFLIGVTLAAELARRTKHPSRWVDQAARTFLGLTDVEAGAVAERAWTDVRGEGAGAAPISMYRRFAERIAAGLQRAGVEPPDGWGLDNGTAIAVKSSDPPLRQQPA